MRKKQTVKQEAHVEKQKAGEETQDEMRGTESPPQGEPMKDPSAGTEAGAGDGSSEEGTSEPEPRIPAEAVARTDSGSLEEELETESHTSVETSGTEIHSSEKHKGQKM